MKNLNFTGRNYSYVERFDCNLSLSYENDRWDTWHIVREIVSNALDSVGGDAARIKIVEENGYISITDDGPGYPIVFAKRIGASSKKEENDSIGQFGEGLKLTALTCLRKGISMKIASQDWLIIPEAAPAEEGVSVLVFDIYKTDQPLNGSSLSIKNTEGIKHYIDNIGGYFLQFNHLTPLFGSVSAGIFPKEENKTKLFNKGVFIREIDALNSYGISINALNRDRDLIEDESMCSKIRSIWDQVDDKNLIDPYFTESYRAASLNTNSRLREFSDFIYPQEQCKAVWKETFYELFTDRGVIYTDDLAAKEACCIGYVPIRLDYCGKHAAEYVGIKKDVEVVKADYAFSWAEKLSSKEESRLSFFHQVAKLVGLEQPKFIKVFESYAKSEYISGIYDSDRDEISLKRDVLNGQLIEALDVYLHEQNHKATGADDYTRAFPDGLSKLLSQLILNFVGKVGFPLKVKLVTRGFQMPGSFSYSGDNMLSRIALLGDEVIIHTAGKTMRAILPDPVHKPYCSERMATLYKGRFYVNIPASIRETLPDEVIFYVAQDVEQI